MRRSRRAYLGLLGGAATTAAAGCFGGTGGSGTPTDGTRSPDGTTAERGTPGHTDTVTGTASSRRFVLDAVADVDTAAADAPLVVFPEALQLWLRRAARTGETVRRHDETRAYSPDPVLPRFETVRLSTPNGAVDGTYDLTAEGGTRYRLLVGADPADPPADATVTPVDGLAESRRAFARAAIDPGERATVYPESELGEWVRAEFFGGFFEYDGDTFRGREIQQTDAAFFSRTAWYVLSLESVDENDAPVDLRLPNIDVSVSRVIDAVLDAADSGTSRATFEGDVPDAVVEFAEETTYLLTHHRVYAVAIG